MLAMGVGIGYVIGALITYGRMNNFIVTLAMLLILRGLMLAFTKGNAVNAITMRARTSSTGWATRPSPCPGSATCLWP